jgi:hypothetical protein
VQVQGAALLHVTWYYIDLPQITSCRRPLRLRTNHGPPGNQSKPLAERLIGHLPLMGRNRTRLGSRCAVLSASWLRLAFAFCSLNESAGSRAKLWRVLRLKTTPLNANAKRIRFRGKRSVDLVGGSSPLLCAPARRPAHLLGYLASPRLAACRLGTYSASTWHLLGTSLALAWHLLRGTTSSLRAPTSLLISGLACISQLPALVLVRLLGAPPTGAPTQRMHLLLGAPTQRVERTYTYYI